MSRLFSHFPSVQDLLESAPLKSVVDRVGRNRALSETARFLDRMRLQAQSAAQHAFQFTSAELAQRVARWITATAPSGQRSIINATGVLLPGDLLGPPLATEAIDAMAHTAGAYQSGDQLAAASALLAKLAGTDSALFFPSAPAAMLASLAALAGSREVLLRRGELERDPQELSLEETARLAGASLREVGSINQTSLADYEQAFNTNTAAIVSVATRHSLMEGSSAPTLEQLASLGSRKNVPLIADLGWAGILDLSEQGLARLGTASKARAAGADLILLRGHGTLGGPTCGIITGRSALIERIAAQPFALASAASAPTLAALTATFQLYDDPSMALRSIPLLTLIATSAENLKLRAERLAPQMAAMSGIASAEAVETRGALAGRRMPGEEQPSWGIALTPKTGSPAELAAQLLAGAQAIATRIENDRIVMDLRSVAPKYDLALVDAVSGLGAEQDETPSL